MRRSALLPAALLLVAACDRDPDPPPAGNRPVAAACVSRPEGSRWAGDYHATAVFGDSDDEAMSGTRLGGVATTDSLVYVLETGRSALWQLRPDLSIVRRIGREGDGPGEWNASVSGSFGGSLRRVSASADRVRIFDGRRVQEFGTDGRFRRTLVSDAPTEMLSPLQSRLVFAGDTLFYSAGGYDPLSSASGGMAMTERTDPGNATEGRLPWAVRMRVDDEDRLILELGLVPVRGKSGVGPAQARPMWDSNGGCAVASDGAEPMLVFAPRGGRQDTIGVPLLDRVDRNDNYAGDLGGVLPAGVRLEEPSAPARVLDLILDPDGFVWLLPVQPDEQIPGGAVEVVRVPLGGGMAATDTVPAFPRAFGAPGVYFSGTRGPNDELLLVRYMRRGEPATTGE